MPLKFGLFNFSHKPQNSITKDYYLIKMIIKNKSINKIDRIGFSFLHFLGKKQIRIKI